MTKSPAHTFRSSIPVRGMGEHMFGIVSSADWPPLLAAFLASAVEFVEALTVVLAIAVVRGLRPALLGTGLALGVLVALVLIIGPTLSRIPLEWAQLALGTLLLLFGMRWLRKAILRAAGLLPLHDEEATFQREKQNMRDSGSTPSARLDTIALAAAFKIVMLEGIEVVFIVIAIGTTNHMLLPASIGALAALFLVVGLGIAIHRPLSRIPENALKFCVGILLSAFGTFWVGEGVGVVWPGSDGAIFLLISCYLVAAILLVRFVRVDKTGAKA
jgi:uncharacterized membrane protein